MSKYILVTSGVCSSLGKGVASASLGSLLECSGLSISMIKCDPYINLDAGNISPFQHGEVYVTEDGAETDLDLGNFARFTSVNVAEDNCITIGKIYNQVIQNERAEWFTTLCPDVSVILCCGNTSAMAISPVSSLSHLPS